ncbi:hypothetical protein IW139_005532 [Coemansia sp. RSA 353]|nr:hypothetical protein GGH16_005020 [Coemansia sp. RSA 560]KAJ2288084.1 hypothetical protein IW139_005532 [Coemansia sp. RSA 353]
MTRLGIRRRFYCFLFHNPELRDELFATSYVVPQRILAGIRSTLFIYCLAVLISNLAVNVAHGAGWNWAAYFTTLTFFGITLYYGFASYTTIAYAWKQQKIRTDGAATLVDSESASQSPPLSDIGEGYIKNSMPREIAQTQPPSLAHQVALASQWILYESFTCFAPLVSLIYWALLFPTQNDILDSGLDTWMGVSMHALNSVLMLCEVGVFAKTPYRYSHFWILFVFLALYLGLAYFMVGVYGFYVYPFFDSRYFGGYIALICLLIIDIIAVVWVIMLMVHRLRDGLYPRWLLKRQRSTVF